MRTLLLSNGTPVLVDDEDFDSLSDVRWTLKTKVYAGNTQKGLMHRVLMGNPAGHVDHIDGNPLNNQKANLRICDRSQNLCNRAKTIRNRSGFKGVYFDKRPAQAKRPWVAEVRKEGKKYFLGTFDSAEEAYAAYCRRAKELHGEFFKV